MPWRMFIWDDGPGGNVEHVLRHDVTVEEFEEVLLRLRSDQIEASRSNPAHRTALGLTDRGRLLRIVWIETGDDTAVPVNAYDPE